MTTRSSAATAPEAAPRPSTGRRALQALRLGGWIAALVVVIVAFGALGEGALAGPALLEPGTWGDWAAGREPLTIAFTVLRLLVVAAAWYLLGVTVIGAVARLLRWGRLVTLADLLTVPAVRRLLQSALGVGLAAAALTSTQPSAPGMAPAVAAAEVASAEGMAVVPTGQSFAAMTTLPDGGQVAVMHLLGDEAGQPAAAATWTVQPGEHFWSCAERVLTDAWGRAPTDPEIVPYWQQLIEANRDRLADPGNPDLVYPGQVFTVPTAPAPPR